MECSKYNHGEDLLILNCGKLGLAMGLRDKNTDSHAAHGAFVVVQDMESLKIKFCTFFDGARITGEYNSEEEMMAQIDKLREREWVWMDQNDMYVTNFGMSLPDDPFWKL